MKMRITAVAGLVLAAACGGTAPPQDGPSPQGAGRAGGMGMQDLEVIGGGPPSVFALIGAREQMGLTGAQVTALDSIGRMWSMRNDSLRRELGEFDGRRRTPEAMERMRPILLRIAENNHWAGTTVGELLSQEQRGIACTLQSPPPAERGRNGRRPTGPRRGMRPSEGNGVAVPNLRASRGWPWCTPPAPAATNPG